MKKINLLICLVVMISAGCGSSNNKVTPVVTVTANDFLAATKYDNLIVEIQYVTGYQPTAASVTNLQNFLQARVNKPGGLIMKVSSAGINSPGKASYQTSELASIEASIRAFNTTGTTASIFIFFADAGFAEDAGSSKTLGIMYSTSAITIFEKAIQGFAGGVGQPSLTNLESTVLMHEAGHILGLVSNGTAMTANHEDATHLKHCNDTSCLMYFQVDTSDFVANLTGGNIPALNTACLNDLKGNGGK